VGTGLILSTKSVTKGVVMGVRDVGHHAVKGTVAGAVEMGADVATVAHSAVRGVIEAARETGGNAGEAAQAAAQGALEAAGALSRTAVEAVTDVLVGVVEGVTDVFGAMLARGTSTTVSGQSSSPPSTGSASTQQWDAQG
jgi:hypothetical protein